MGKGEKASERETPCGDWLPVCWMPASHCENGAPEDAPRLSHCVSVGPRKCHWAGACLLGVPDPLCEEGPGWILQEAAL